MGQAIRLVWESQEAQLPRVAFQLRIKAGKEAEYDAAHRNVWPALLSKLKEVGISEYSIFRRNQDLFLVIRVDDFDAASRATRTQSEMATRDGETDAPSWMAEVFAIHELAFRHFQVQAAVCAATAS